MHLASDNGHSNVVKLLLHHKAEHSIRDEVSICIVVIRNCCLDYTRNTLYVKKKSKRITTIKWIQGKAITGFLVSNLKKNT